MKNKSVLLCSLNSQYVHSSLAVHALGAAYYNYCRDFKEEPATLILREYTINDSEKNIFSNIVKENTDIIAFSVYIWNCELTAKICRLVKTVFPNKMIILGGPEVSYGMENGSFEEDSYDYVIKGEGERSFFSLVSKINDDSFFPPLQWNFLMNKKEVSTDIALSLDEFPFAYNDENRHLFLNRIAYYESSRGCPFSCAYCLSSVKEKLRFLSLERVKKEVDFFAENNFEQIKFVDRTFNADSERAYDIWKYIIEKHSDSRTNFHFEIAADLITEKQQALLKTAPVGLIQLEAGIQSTNEKTLSESCRKTDNKKAFDAIKKLVKNGNINIHTDLIIGLPYETTESFKKSFNDAFSLNSHQLQLGFLKLLHGTRMNDIKEKHGYLFSPYPPYEFLKNDYISFDEMMKLKMFEETFEKYYNSFRFVFSLEYLIEKSETPFDFFNDLTNFVIENKIDLSAVSMNRHFDLLSEFSKNNYEQYKEIQKLLLLDFYSVSRSGILPSELKEFEPMRKVTAPLTREILEKNNLLHRKNIAVRFIENEIRIFDYSTKNPVTGRYSFISE